MHAPIANRPRSHDLRTVNRRASGSAALLGGHGVGVEASYDRGQEIRREPPAYFFLVGDICDDAFDFEIRDDLTVQLSSQFSSPHSSTHPRRWPVVATAPAHSR